MNPLADDEDGICPVESFPIDRVALCRPLRAEALDLFGEVGEGYDFRYESRALIY